MGLEKEIELLINKEELQIAWGKKACNPEFLKSASPKGNRCELWEVVKNSY